MDQACELYCLIFHPTLLCSSNHIAQKFVAPITENEKLDYFFLQESNEQHKKVLDAIVKIHQLDGTPNSEMKMVEMLNRIWISLCDILPAKKETENFVNEDLHRVQKMLAYIQKNYADGIELESICKAGEVGKTKGTQLFDQYLHMTPVDYLIGYRLEIASRMLKETSNSVTEIALATGFSDSSYFARTFRKRMGVSPLTYRREMGRD